MHLQHVYTSVACNATPESLDWGAQNLIVYAATNAVVLYAPSERRVIRTLCAHKARVNTVKWAQTDGSDNANVATLITGSDDNLCIVHRIADIRDEDSAVTSHILSGHTGGVKFLDSIRCADGSLLIATAASDSTMKLWRPQPGESSVFECIQTLPFALDLCLAVRLCSLDASASAVLLALGVGDKVQVYRVSLAADNDNSAAQLLQTLVGHEDWVRGLDFVHNAADDEVLLASSSQDSFIRLWKLRNAAGDQPNSFGLESVLAGHDGWVYSVQWSRDAHGQLQLLSSSMDKSMIVWQPAADDGIWTECVRIGDIGGHFLGFFGAKMAPGGRALLGHGYHGSFHLWTIAKTDEADEAEVNADADGEDVAAERWQPGVLGLGGHFGEARDVAWEPRGRFALSVSADQTTRVHAPCSGAATDVAPALWHELARPQVHGYDMQAIAVLSRYRFASGAEEKIVRTFQAPGEFVQSLRSVCGVLADAEGDTILYSKSKAATLPSLGLSNQATVAESSDSSAQNNTGSSTTPPTEETLMQNTLWPETQKLYGHGYEVYSLSATRDGRLLASACKATSTEHAQIILWNTHTWKQHQRLEAHQLTITQMRFSPDDRCLLSVSRDRRWSVFERGASSADALPEYSLLETTGKSNGVHGRIIWTCDWTPDSRYFATGSRDGKCVMWHAVDEQHPSKSTLQHFVAVDVLDVVGHSVTAVAIAPRHQGSGIAASYLVAIGTDAGEIRLCRFAAEKWIELRVLGISQAHHATVRKLEFRPGAEEEASTADQLVSCGNDHFVRVYEITH